VARSSEVTAPNHVALVEGHIVELATAAKIVEALASTNVEGLRIVRSSVEHRVDDRPVSSEEGHNWGLMATSARPQAEARRT